MLRMTQIREAVPDAAQQPDADPEDYRIVDELPFGSKGSTWATMFEIFMDWEHTSGLTRILHMAPDTLGYTFMIRIASPGYVETDPRFQPPRSLRFEEFVETEIIASIKALVSEAPTRSLRKAFKYLEMYFYMDDPDDPDLDQLTVG